jgi:hypothetical protein
MSSADHVVIVTKTRDSGDATEAKCLRCGGREELISPGGKRSMDGFIALGRAFEKQHKDCTGPIIEEPTPKDPLEWLRGDDTGTSSRTIWSVMMRRNILGSFGADVPHDGADFGRCHRLLQAFPEWKRRLPEVVKRYPAWAALVEHWDEVERLYLEAVAHPGEMRGRGRQRRYESTVEEDALYDRIGQLIGRQP